MIRPVLFALMFSGSVFALSPAAYAQTSPDTRQTDQSEEDWRKSKKKGGTDSEDILDIIKNTRSTGVGNGRGYSPIDALPEESRRHLMKERAKRMAQAGPNETVDVSYTPSEAAKSDSNLQDDEKKAWKKMAQGMNGAPDQGQQGQGQGQQGQGQQGQQGQGQGQGQQGQQGQSQQGQQQGGGSGQQGQQQGGGQSSDASAQNGSSRSVMRGGSAASVSDIMARIKGLGPAGGQTGNGGTGQSPTGQGRQQGQAQIGQSPFGQSQQGQDSQGQMPQGQSPQGQTQPSSQGQQGQSTQGQGQQGQSPQQGQNQGQQQDQNQGQSQSQSQQDGQQQSDSQSQADAEAKAQADAASKATSAAQDQNAAQAQSPQRVPKAVSPLDRLKKINREQTNSGSRSSASDYLKKKE